MDTTSPALSAREYWCNSEQSRFVAWLGSGAVESPDVHDAREALELELRAIKLVESSVLSRYNALAAVNRLPREVLAHILNFLRRISEPVGNIPGAHMLNRKSTVMGWVQATHVCRLWRAIALERPQLWSEIPFGLGHEWRDEFLRRSRSVPIVWHYPKLPHRELLPYHEYRHFGGRMRDHLYHIQELRTTGAFEDIEPVLGFLDMPAPLLEKVVINNTLNPNSSVIDEERPVPYFYPKVFQQSAPRLRHFALKRCHIQWQELTFSTIVHLSLELDSDFETFRSGDLGDTLAALERLPVLQFLRLVRVLPPPPKQSKPASTIGPIVSLPNLQGFILADCIVRCGLLLKHLIVPPTAEHQSMLLGCTRLHSAVLEGCCAKDLCELCTMDHPSAVFPSLVSLSLSKIDFPRLGLDVKLPQWLERRASLKRLTIEDCTIDYGTVRKLQAVVPEVKWDYIEDRMSEDEDEDDEDEVWRWTEC